MNDLSEWLTEFLWYWQDSELLCGEAAHGIVRIIEIRLQYEKKDELHPFPKPLDYLRELENLVH